MYSCSIPQVLRRKTLGEQRQKEQSNSLPRPDSTIGRRLRSHDRPPVLGHDPQSTSSESSHDSNSLTNLLTDAFTDDSESIVDEDSPKYDAKSCYLSFFHIRRLSFD